MNPTNQSLRDHELISTRAIDRYRTSSDASHFHLIPTGVATPKSVAEIAQLFKFASETNKSVTFRSGGTSLSGQAVTDALLIDTRRHFRKIEVLNGGAQVRVEPGATVRAVNAQLARFGRKLGPDPASEIACTIGGVIANNSSGMACGITDNTYRTLQSATIVLSNGSIINTADHDSDTHLKSADPGLYATLVDIKNQINLRPDLAEQIRNQYQIKNTMGYGLNSFTDFDAIVDIFLHLLIGSEGTLGFISEAVFSTVPLLKHAATTLLIFENLISATSALPALIATNPSTIELMDRASLRAGKVDLGGIELKDHAALLVEYQTIEKEVLLDLMSTAAQVHYNLGTINETQLTTSHQTRAELWRIRKGLYAAVASARRSGTTALLEDIAVPVKELAETCIALQKLFAKHGYEDAVIFGHAKDGNIHFLINEDFSLQENSERYQAFTEEMVNLVLSKNGSLKAEHGTGRMMAPFVERQFGSELYGLMIKIKEAFDPCNILNPGVLISADAYAHIHNIKFNPPIEAVANSCVECGYCEPICPSKDLTTTPRQRIVIRRALSAAKLNGDSALFKELSDESTYDVEETCAVDGLCESSCPVGINTGALVKELRSARSTGLSRSIWEIASDHWSSTTQGISGLLTLSKRIPAPILQPINRGLRSIFGNEIIPLWSNDLPSGGSPRIPSIHKGADFVLFTSCLGSMFDSKTAESLKSLAQKVGLSFTTPPQIADLCCGTPWASKGLEPGYTDMINRTYEALLKASDNGRLPIVCENSSCTEGLINAIKAKANQTLQIIDAIDFTADFLLPKLTVTQKLDSVVLHPTCSSTLLGSNENFERLAHAISENVSIPTEWGCCAFAGDRGMLHPELTASATAKEAAAIIHQKFDAYLSTNSPCEIGMSRATGEKYEHILNRLDQLAQPK